MIHRTTPRFWRSYEALPPDVQKIADKNFELLKQDPRHPSLQFKRIGRFWSVRAGIGYRALAIQEGTTIAWFWIGDHDEYDRIISGR